MEDILRCQGSSKGNVEVRNVTLTPEEGQTTVNSWGMCGSVRDTTAVGGGGGGGGGVISPEVGVITSHRHGPCTQGGGVEREGEETVNRQRA